MQSGYEIYGEMIRRLREQIPLTREELACMIRKDVKTLYRIETGITRRPAPGTIRRLSEALGVQTSVLLRKAADCSGHEMAEIKRRSAGLEEQLRKSEEENHRLLAENKRLNAKMLRVQTMAEANKTDRIHGLSRPKETNEAPSWTKKVDQAVPRLPKRIPRTVPSWMYS